jgi:hypothetical protein
MGRGRAKAKQTKVARDLKYRTHETDFGALAQELHGGSTRSAGTSDDDLDSDLDDDETSAEADQRDDWSDWSDAAGPSGRG